MLEKILFVDDEPQVLEGYERLLRPEFCVETCISGAEALAKLAEHGPYAVVVCDMRMPEMDGLQLLRTIMIKSPDAVRIMLTGNMDQQTAVKAVNQGCVFRFLNKPCEEHVLRQTLNAALVQYRLAAYKDGILEKARGAAVQKVELRTESSAAALAEIEQYVREVLGQEAVTRLAASTGGIYIGKMIWEDPDHIVQRLSGTRAIAHQKKLLNKNPAIGDVVRIEYSCGKASVKEINS